MENDESLDPAAALTLVAGSRARLADRLVTPWWYHPVLGVLVGGVVASQALPSPWAMLALPVYLIGWALLVRSYRRLTGVWISGFHPAAPKGVLWGVLVGVALLVLTAAVLDVGFDLWWAPVIAGVLAVPIVVVGGRSFDRVLRASLR